MLILIARIVNSIILTITRSDKYEIYLNLDTISCKDIINKWIHFYLKKNMYFTIIRKNVILKRLELHSP